MVRISISPPISAPSSGRWPTCRCAGNPEAYHGPYFQWHHCQDGRTVHKTITPDQVALMERAIANHREILRLLAVWEQETVDLVLSKPDEQKTRSGKTR